LAIGVIDKVEISASLLKVTALALAASNKIMYFLFLIEERALGVQAFSKLTARISPKDLGPK
jgi:hypothetical protein